MSEEPILKVDHIEVYYGNFHVLWDISLEVKRGEIVSLIGANGAGKTTTLNTKWVWYTLPRAVSNLMEGVSTG